jgi:CelD/BcsL family acetyltransferase involved in cellulose biosynthesis
MLVMYRSASHIFPNMIQVELVTEYPVSQSFWDAWRELAQTLPMRQPEWLLSWWEVFRPIDAGLFLLTARDGDRLVGLAPCYRLSSERQLRLLGDGEVCTDYNGILVATDFTFERVTNAFAEWLLKHSRDQNIGWDSTYLEGIAIVDAPTRDLHHALAKEGGAAMDRNPMSTWRVDLRDGWEGYLAKTSKDTRKRLRRRIASLEDVHVCRVKSEEDWKNYFPILIDLHQRRRESLGEPGCFANQSFRSFLELASKRFLPLGQLTAFYIQKEGKPIAAEIGFRSREYWYCYQSGIEPSAMDLEPGKMANVWMMSQAQAQGIVAIDFLRGDEPYKKQLKADPRGISDLWVARPGWKGRSQKWLWQSKDILCDTARSLYQSFPIPQPRCV